jgi:hypothetical protein
MGSFLNVYTIKYLYFGWKFIRNPITISSVVFSVLEVLVQSRNYLAAAWWLDPRESRFRFSSRKEAISLTELLPFPTVPPPQQMLGHLSNYMLHNPSWEASQEILRLLWNQKFHYCVHKSPPSVPTWRNSFLKQASLHTFPVHHSRYDI